MVAKVTSQGKTFFVKKGEDIHSVPQYDGLPLTDKKILALSSIEGSWGGFALTFGADGRIVVTRHRESPLPPPPVFGAKWEIQENITALVLPAGTRIEPMTRRQMEDDIRAQQKPSHREK